MSKAYVELSGGQVIETENPELWNEAKRLTVKEGKARLRAESAARLRSLLPPGATVHTVLRHVSASGMSRSIDLYTIIDGEPFWLSGLARLVLDMPEGKAQGIKVVGCGMDMGFHLVYSLSRALYPDGAPCIGEGCPSNDHSNGDRDYTPHGHRGPMYVPEEKETLRHWHGDGGYTLCHRWL